MQRERRMLDKAVLAGDRAVLAGEDPEPTPRSSSARAAPRGPDHLRHIGRTASPPPPTRAEAVHRLRTYGHEPAARLASQRIGEHAGAMASAAPAIGARQLREMHAGQGRGLLWQ